jgi:hypothetical protein
MRAQATEMNSASVTGACSEAKGRETPRDAVQWDAVHWEAMLVRIQGEFREMPGLCPTLAQAARLWSLDMRTAEALLADLVHRGVLRRVTGERYVTA